MSNRLQGIEPSPRSRGISAEQLEFLTPADRERFWTAIKAKTTRRGCWIGRKATTVTDDYATFTVRRRTFSVHQLAYALAHGELPPGLDVCHHCDVKACGKPEHLFTGTTAMNAQDFHDKGRAISARLREVHARLFEEDIFLLQRIAGEKGLPWQIELRLTLRRALRGETREITILKEKP